MYLSPIYYGGEVDRDLAGEDLVKEKEDLEGAESGEDGG